MSTSAVQCFKIPDWFHFRDKVFTESKKRSRGVKSSIGESVGLTLPIKRLDNIGFRTSRTPRLTCGAHHFVEIKRICHF